MKPKKGVSAYDGTSPSLGFIRNQSILEKMLEKLKEVEGFEIRYDSSVESIAYNPSTKESLVSTSGEGGDLPCDLLVAADGMHSPVMTLVGKHLAGGKELKSRIGDRGYYVYRGYLSKRHVASIPADALASSFQSWGAGGLRFAVVPASGGGVSWFAAVSQPVQANMRISSVKSDRIRSGPFANDSWAASVDDLTNLRSTFSDWHQPIPNLINLSLGILKDDGKKRQRRGAKMPKRSGESPVEVDMEEVSICRAVSSESGPSRGSNAVFTTRPSDQDGGDSLPHGKLAIASVGDAFYTFDPILAVGGGEGVVAADLLASCLQRHPEDLQKGLLEYEKENSTRAQVLSVISDIAQSLGSIRSPVLRAYLDVILTWLLPSGAKGRAMDSLIRITAGL